MNYILDKINALKNNPSLLRKILFYILAPLALIFIVLKFLMNSNVSKANDDLKKTQIDDNKLQEDQDKLNKQANDELAKANEAKNEADKHIEDAKNTSEQKDDVNTDWNKK
jgi:ATP-dependent Zn protease